ncbi:SigE family RNA polymerase sigma factor [Longispora sp. K20-0274]|uniref:SigE family RNA polymerase sigma factor n=1 Tax=Longispora sp. K20-0274 TaxID=3088255 RepID=UPI00399A4829
MMMTYARDGTLATSSMEPGFVEFYGANFSDLAAQLYVYLGDMGEAQDVVQEAFCRAWVRWGRISRYEEPVGWVRRVAWNLATSRIRRLIIARRYARLERPRTVDGPAPDRVALMAALATLPANQRRAVVLHYLADMSVAQIADMCGAREGAVKTWLYRGRAALASQLRESEEASPHAR